MRKGGLPLNRKFIILSLYFFSTICLFSVGFSSWTICMGDKLTASGNIVAEDVFNYSDYINFNGDVQGFMYCDGGFLTNDLKLSNTGTCTANMTINVDNCLTHYKDYTDLKIIVEFKHGQYCNFDIFSNDNTTISYSVYANNTLLHESINGEIINSESNVVNDSYKISITLNDYASLANTEGKIELSVQIHFTLNNNISFSTLLHEINNNNVNFKCDVTMEGC